jgi:hypothetical protein
MLTYDLSTSADQVHCKYKLKSHANVGDEDDDNDHDDNENKDAAVAYYDDYDDDDGDDDDDYTDDDDVIHRRMKLCQGLYVFPLCVYTTYRSYSDIKVHSPTTLPFLDSGLKLD